MLVKNPESPSRDDALAAAMALSEKLARAHPGCAVWMEESLVGCFVIAVAFPWRREIRTAEERAELDEVRG